jgi:hypothetical protein
MVKEKKQNRFPKDWDDARVQAVLEHYESQTEREAVAEDEAACCRRDQTTMVVPTRLVPTITKLITLQKNGGSRTAQKSGGQKSR